MKRYIPLITAILSLTQLARAADELFKVKNFFATDLKIELPHLPYYGVSHNDRTGDGIQFIIVTKNGKPLPFRMQKHNDGSNDILIPNANLTPKDRLIVTSHFYLDGSQISHVNPYLSSIRVNNTSIATLKEISQNYRHTSDETFEEQMKSITRNQEYIVDKFSIFFDNR